MKPLRASKSELLPLIQSPLTFARGFRRLQLNRSQSTLSHLRRHLPSVNVRRHLPRIFSPELWETVLPSSFRSTLRTTFTPKTSQPTNPATYFIWIYILIGSQAIRILQTKAEYDASKRRADLQIDKLREVVRKLQAGEEVDVEKVLGTDNDEEEEAWDAALREIEREERMWQKSKAEKREEARQRKELREREEKEKIDANPVSGGASEVNTSSTTVPTAVDGAKPPFTAPGFY